MLTLGKVSNNLTFFICGEKPEVWITMIFILFPPVQGVRPTVMTNKETKRSWHSVTAQRKQSLMFLTSQTARLSISQHRRLFLSGNPLYCCLCWRFICFQWYFPCSKMSIRCKQLKPVTLTTMCPIGA